MGPQALSAIGFIILRLGDSLTSFNKDNTANFFLAKKMHNEAIRGVYYLRIREKMLEFKGIQLEVSLSVDNKTLMSCRSTPPSPPLIGHITALAAYCMIRRAQHISFRK